MFLMAAFVSGHDYYSPSSQEEPEDNVLSGDRSHCKKVGATRLWDPSKPAPEDRYLPNRNSIQ